MENTLYASFVDASDAEKAVGALLDQGVRKEDISVITSQNRPVVQTEYTNSDSNTAVTTTDAPNAVDADKIEHTAKTGISTTTGADAEAGAVKGLGWGVGLGILAGIASLAVPGVGLILGGGALATAIGGAVATAGAGAAAGAVTGYLKDQGVDSQIAEDYERSIRNGGALIAVNVPSNQIGEGDVRGTLVKYGAMADNLHPTAYFA